MLQRTNFSKTDHGIERQQARLISDDQIEFACQYGTRLHAGGAVIYHVLRKDLPAWLEDGWAPKLHGLTVVVSRDGAILTTYRAPGAYRDLKKRDKRAWAMPRFSQRLAN